MHDEIIRCRKCGKPMKVDHVTADKIKLTCVGCNVMDYQAVTTKSMNVNPHLPKDFSSHINVDSNSGVVFEVRKGKEIMEIITLEEISMLVSSDYALDKVLEEITEKTAKRLKVDVCSVYLNMDGKLVLSGTYGLSKSAVGKVSLNIGEGITGAAAQTGKYISLKKASEDPRYKYFPETEEEKYNAMMSFPIVQNGTVYGVLNVETKEERNFAEDEIYFISILANLILGAIKIRGKKTSAN